MHKASSFPKIGRSDFLGRYYTKNDIGALLIDQMDVCSPNRILDLGAGSGSLSRAVLERWADVELVTVDVDARAYYHISKLLSPTGAVKHKHICADALSNRIPELIAANTQHIDAAVCNPPFIVPKWRKGFAQIVEEAGFANCLSVLSDVDAALLFLAQNLRLLSANATLGIILPDSLISAYKYRLFRRELMDRYTVRKVIQLPRSSFASTDAQAHIIVISKSGYTNGEIPLFKFGAEFGQRTVISVSTDEGVCRLDYDFHAHRNEHPKAGSKYVPLQDLVEDLRRGTFTSSEAREKMFPVFHTTDMTPSINGTWTDLANFNVEPLVLDSCKADVKAEPGDILIARVGRNLEEKVLGVLKGAPVLTDCIYKLRVRKEFRKLVFAQLSSIRGQAWLASRAYGVSARQLAKMDLLQFPVAV
jgi:type I restriction enzyme M protein